MKRTKGGGSESNDIRIIEEDNRFDMMRYFILNFWPARRKAREELENERIQYNEV